jgi:outer membrane protein insertion porin family
LQLRTFTKKIDFDVPALDEAELKKYERKLQKLYRDKNYHQVTIDATMELDEQHKAVVIFTINEGKKTLVNRILFAGNKNLSSKELRKILYTREDWILSFLDGAGSYQPERLEADKHVLELYYQNQGYLKAKVIDAQIIKDDACNTFTLIFHIEEGPCFTVSEVRIDGQGILDENYLLTHLPVQCGQRYSRDNIADAIKILEMLWGDLGYIYAHIDPAIQPNEDANTVKISFETDKGNQVLLNTITILGNKKTRDRIIRRRLLLEEGSLLTYSGMEESKRRVESLGYFDLRDGVNWKIRRVDSEHANLDLMVKEIKTGRANLKIGFGGSPTSVQVPGASVSVGVEVADTNLFGTGLQLNFQGDMSKDEQNIFFNLTEPWLFDKPILGAFDLYHRRPSYDEFRNTEPVNEILTGGSLTVGFVTPLFNETQVVFKAGIDSLNYEKRPVSLIRAGATAESLLINAQYQHILDQEFEPVDFVWLSCVLSQDKRNNPIHPSRGIRWIVGSRLGLPSLDSNVGFYKFDADFHWFTPIIGDTDLILHFHTYLGIIARFQRKIIPYRELFHIGGPASVRGFIFGQVSPLFITDSIGGKKAFYVNVELIFPVTPDFNTKGLIFYDGGCGWDNPYVHNVNPLLVRNNSFNYRHAVGIGIRMLSPAPIRIDWGFKLDRKKKLHETPNEIHFGASYDW